VRALLLRVLRIGGLHLSEIAARHGDEGLELTATVSGEAVSEDALELAVQRLAAEAGLLRVRWMSLDEG